MWSWDSTEILQSSDAHNKAMDDSRVALQNSICDRLTMFKKTFTFEQNLITAIAVFTTVTVLHVETYNCKNKTRNHKVLTKSQCIVYK